MRKLALLLPLFLMACTASPERLNKVADIEAARIEKPDRKLSSFAHYELKPMILSAEVKEKPEKVAQAKILEQKLREQVQPLLAEWSAADKTGRSGTLVIQPELLKLRVISGGSRFWIGGWAGESFIDMDLRLTDGETGHQILKPRISKRAGSWGGAWSVGQTDKNLLDYIAYITRRYLERNY